MSVKRFNRVIPIIGVILFAACALVAPSSAMGAEPPKAPVKVAVLPFSMHAPSNLAYLQDGIRDMLVSRLAWQGKVQVIERAAVDQAIKGTKSDLSPDEALRVGKTLKADYVLYGSLTAIGQSISIDSKMAPISGSGEPISLSVQTKTMDDVIPQINQFAQNINQKVFARPGQQAQTEASDGEPLANRNPELLIPGAVATGDRISYLNPNFIEITSESSLRQAGIWRSQTFNGGFLSMDVGDVDGDGKDEVVGVMTNKVIVLKREAQGLRPIGTYEGNKADRFVTVSVFDAKHDGRAVIFVTNLRKQNYSGAGGTESAKANRGFDEQLASFAMTFTGGKLQMLGKPVGYFLNVVEFPKRGKVLLGQEKGDTADGAFKSGIYEMQLRGDTLAPTVQASLPDRCNVYNFARVDLKGDRNEHTIVIDNSNNLLILNPAGDVTWRGDRQFATTTNTFEGKLHDRRFNMVDFYAIPSPILVTDLNKDGIPEIIVNRSTEMMGRFMPEGLKYFDRGEIVSLSWDQMGLVENWKTREISGMVTGIRIADLNHDGKYQLIGSLIQAKDFLKLWESKSTFFSYDLNIAPSTKTSQKTP